MEDEKKLKELTLEELLDRYEVVSGNIALAKIGHANKILPDAYTEEHTAVRAEVVRRIKAPSDESQ